MPAENNRTAHGSASIEGHTPIALKGGLPFPNRLPFDRKTKRFLKEMRNHPEWRDTAKLLLENHYRFVQGLKEKKSTHLVATVGGG